MLQEMNFENEEFDSIEEELQHILEDSEQENYEQPQEDNNSQPKTSKKTFKWNDKNTRLLISLRHSREKIFSQPKCKKKKLWDSIARRMLEIGGYCLTGDECHLKYRNLLQTYKNNKKKANQSGSESIQWPYYRLFNDALGNKSSINPQPENIGSSIEENNSSSGNDPVNDEPCQRREKVSKRDWKQQYLDSKLKLKKSHEERKLQEWKEKKEIEEKKIEVLLELNNSLKEYNKIRNREIREES